MHICIYVVCINLGVPRGPCHKQLQFSTIPLDLLTCLRRRPLVTGQTPGQRDALAALQSRVLNAKHHTCLPFGGRGTDSQEHGIPDRPVRPRCASVQFFGGSDF